MTFDYLIKHCQWKASLLANNAFCNCTSNRFFKDNTKIIVNTCLVSMSQEGRQRSCKKSAQDGIVVRMLEENNTD